MRAHLNLGTGLSAWSTDDLLAVVAVAGAGIVGGVLFAFSTFVMSGLDRLPPDDSIAAMQAINRQAPTPAFMIALLGTAAWCVVVGVRSLRALDVPGAGWRLAGALFYLVTIAITAVFHIPRNNRLAAVQLPDDDAVRTWHAYAVWWTRMNHVRAATAIAAAVAFAISLHRP